MGAPLPSGTVTVLLGDIEESSRRWENDATGMAAAVASLDRLVARGASSHGGTRPLEQGEGDSFVVAFPRASDAVGCALAIQLALVDDADTRAADLRVRMALHTGEVDIRDGSFYVGPTMNRCGRLRALAHGGQVLVSQTTRDVVAEQLPDGATLVDLGEYRLRDLSRHERIHQLAHPALPREFPPIHGLDAVPNNLPVRLTTFLGRDDELVQLGGVLGSARIVTLTGSGGCGKTRLALHAAAEHLDGFPGGAWWADLAPLQEPALVANAVAAALSIGEVPGEDLNATIARHVAQRPPLLLVLDNCEHLVDACAELAADLLRSCPLLTIVATSREPLGVEGEVAFRVPSLDLPVDPVTSAAGLQHFEATRLFLDRASRARAGWVPVDAEADVVAAICRRLDGIPLAIELAAAKIRVLSPEQIADGLTDRFRLLTGGVRTAVPRQRTLEASVDWSYSLLSPVQRIVFERLSVFVGTFSLDAAEHVCAGGDVDRYAILDTLSELVDRSLVQTEDATHEVRYRLLETIRVYARQRLADSGELEAAHDRHLSYYASLADRGARGLRGTSVHEWAQRLDAELDNVRAALDWALASTRTDDHLRLCSALITYWLLRSLSHEIAHRIGAALAASEGDPVVRGKALATASLGSVMAGHYVAAEQLAEEAVRLAEASGDRDGLRTGLQHLGWAKLWRGRGGLPEIVAAGEGDLPDLTFRLRHLLYRATAEALLVSPLAARPFFEEAHDLGQQMGDEYFGSVLDRFHGASELVAGDLARAASLLERSVTSGRALGNATFVTLALEERAWVEALRGDHALAWSLMDEAATVASELGPHMRAVTSHFTGLLLTMTGHAADAVETLDTALAAWREMGSAFQVAAVLRARGWAAAELGDVRAARAFFDDAVDVGRRASHPWNSGNALVGRAALHRRLGDRASAEDDAGEGLDVLARYGDAVGVTDALEVLGGLAVEAADVERGARLLGAAAHLRGDIGYQRLPIHDPTYDADVAAGREAVGDAAFAVWLREGQRLALPDAVHYARRGRGQRHRPSFGWDGLTPAELEVAKHVADGLSNPQIAEALFVSRNTVKTHVSHIFAKLGLTTRAELASEFARRAADQPAAGGTSSDPLPDTARSAAT